MSRPDCCYNRTARILYWNLSLIIVIWCLLFVISGLSGLGCCNHKNVTPETNKYDPANDLAFQKKYGRPIR